MYTMPLGEEGTYSFDLLFKGIEITTGEQRIHEYESYLEVFKYVGLVIGLERIIARLLDLENIREATLFTRNRKRLIP